MNLHFVHERFLTRTLFFNDGYLDKGGVGMVKYIPYICGNERKEYHFITIRESGPPAESPDGGEGRKCVRERRVAPRWPRYGQSDKKEWNRDFSPLVLMVVQGAFLFRNEELGVRNELDNSSLLIPNS